MVSNGHYSGHQFQCSRNPRPDLPFELSIWLYFRLQFWLTSFRTLALNAPLNLKLSIVLLISFNTFRFGINTGSQVTRKCNWLEYMIWLRYLHTRVEVLILDIMLLGSNKKVVSPRAISVVAYCSLPSKTFISWMIYKIIVGTGKWIQYDDDNPIPQREEDITKLSGGGMLSYVTFAIIVSPNLYSPLPQTTYIWNSK